MNTPIHLFCRSDANKISFGAETIKIANVSITTESSIVLAEASGTADSVLAFASDNTVANALWRIIKAKITFVWRLLHGKY